MFKNRTYITEITHCAASLNGIFLSETHFAIIHLIKLNIKQQLEILKSDKIWPSWIIWN